MTITNTSRLKLRQITYLHDGEESADAFNETMTILDAIFTFIIPYRSINTDENAGTDTPINGGMVINRATGRPVLNRLALPY